METLKKEKKETTGSAINTGRDEFGRTPALSLENTRTLAFIGLSQHSEGCPNLGAHQVSFHPLGLELRIDLKILSKLVMYGC